MHQWPGTAFSAHAIGHKGMLKASKILSMTIIDYVESKSLQEAILDDFKRNKKSYNYKSILTSSPPTAIINSVSLMPQRFQGTTVHKECRRP